ncbi:MAG: NADH-quinone oxidoreductase subunit J [Candidatus Eisenbacteria bacterium]
MTSLLFYAAALVAVGSAVLVISRRNPVHSVVALIACLLSFALLFLLLGAQFVAALQIIVYAGAIVVLFLFVVMLLNVRGERVVFHSSLSQKVMGLLLVGVILVQTVSVAVISVRWVCGAPWLARESLSFGTVQATGRELFGRYLFQFEVASVLLLAAIVGAVAIAKRKVK